MKDFSAQKTELLAKKAEKLANANKAVEDGKLEDAKALRDEIVAINDTIATLDDLAAASAAGAAGSPPAGDPTGAPAEDVKPYQTLGAQLQDIARAAKTGKVSDALARVQDSALGANEGVGADGGFAIQSDFASGIMESAVASSPLLSMLDIQTLSAASNQMRILTPKETDVSSSVFGGVRMYWAAEAAGVEAGKAAFEEMKIDVEKMMGTSYVTDEMLADAPFLTGFLGRAFSLAGDRLLTEAVINGDGVGKPLGMLNSGALVTVAKETSQAADTFLGANAVKMLARSMLRNRQRFVWLMHPDLETQLPLLEITAGGASKFLWNPEGGLGALAYQQILGKNVVFDDSCKALGDKGDVLLCDPSQYMLIKKGTAKQDWSIHVQFLTDQSVFRLVFRVNGAPKVNSALTLKNSANTRSPFVTLAARA